MSATMARVCLITSRFPFGSKEAFLREEIAHIANVCDVVVLPALPTRDPSTQPGVAALRLRLFSPMVLVAAIKEVLRDPRRSFRVFRDVVRAPRTFASKCKNACVFPTGLAAGRYLRSAGATHVHAYWLAIPATVAYVAASMSDLPWSATGHRYDLVDSNMSGDVRSSFLATARFIRAISHSGEARVRSRFGSTETRLLTEHLGVRIPERTAPHVVHDHLRLICAANLEPVKGHATLLDALVIARDRGTRVQCTLAGDGTRRSALERYVRKYQLQDCVSFAGAVPHEALLEQVQRGFYDAAILTSVDLGPKACEGIPIALAECMAAGLPVIATRSGAVAELVDPTNGILCAPGDAHAVADAIDALACSAALRTLLGRAARDTIVAKFDVRKTAPRLASLLEAGL